MARNGARYQETGRFVTTVRLDEKLTEQMKRFCHTKRISQTELLTTALSEFFQRNPIVTERYHLVVKKDHVIFMRINDDDVRILEVEQRNGVSVEKIQERFSLKVHEPVHVVREDEGDTRCP